MAADGKRTMTAIRPQPGPQEAFLASPADIAIYGGAAFGGKTFALLLEPLRHIENPEFGAVIFRRESTQITNEGGLWDTAMKLYPLLGATPRVQPKLMYRFPSGCKVSFGHLQYETDVLDWQGAQVALFGFDELTHFTRQQFFYMLSRNRSLSGVKPYIRGTTNPDSDSWVADFISWWVDQDTGYPISERSGALRWFVRIDDSLCWGDSPDELAKRFGVPASDAKSVTFIAARAEDNQIGMRKDPGYVANLKALGRVERERLLEGNWKVRPAAGMYFRRAEAEIIERAPDDIVATCRSWDLAATEPSEANPNPDWTAGVKLGRRSSGQWVVLHVERLRKRAATVRAHVRDVAETDGRGTRIRLQQDPGQAGKDQAQSYVTLLAGYSVTARTVNGNKVTRANPVSAQWQAGNIQVVRGPWTEAFLAELEAFPEGAKDDQVDALAEAFDELRNTQSGHVAVAGATLDLRGLHHGNLDHLAAMG